MKLSPSRLTDLGVCLDEVSGKRDGVLLRSASLRALLGHIVHLHRNIASIVPLVHLAAKTSQFGLAVFFCVSVAVMSALDPPVKACAMSDSSMLKTVHSTMWCVFPSRQTLPRRTLLFPC